MGCGVRMRRGKMVGWCWTKGMGRSLGEETFNEVDPRSPRIVTCDTVSPGRNSKINPPTVRGGCGCMVRAGGGDPLDGVPRRQRRRRGTVLRPNAGAGGALGQGRSVWSGCLASMGGYIR
jgi:hypothetical protein